VAREAAPGKWVLLWEGVGQIDSEHVHGDFVAEADIKTLKGNFTGIRTGKSE